MLAAVISGASVAVAVLWWNFYKHNNRGPIILPKSLTSTNDHSLFKLCANDGLAAAYQSNVPPLLKREVPAESLFKKTPWIYITKIEKHPGELESLSSLISHCESRIEYPYVQPFKPPDVGDRISVKNTFFATVLSKVDDQITIQHEGTLKQESIKLTSLIVPELLFNELLHIKISLPNTKVKCYLGGVVSWLQSFVELHNFTIVGTLHTSEIQLTKERRELTCAFQNSYILCDYKGNCLVGKFTLPRIMKLLDGLSIEIITEPNVEELSLKHYGKVIFKIRVPKVTLNKNAWHQVYQSHNVFWSMEMGLKLNRMLKNPKLEVVVPFQAPDFNKDKIV